MLLIFLSGRVFGQAEKHDSLFYPYKHGVYLDIIGNAETLLSCSKPVFHWGWRFKPCLIMIFDIQAK